MAYAAGRNNSLTDVPGVRAGHFTLVRTAGASRVRTGLTAIFASPEESNGARPAAIVTLGGRTEITGLNFVDDFGFLTSPIVATSMRSLGRVYDAMLSRRTRAPLGWPPIVVGFDDGRLSDQRRAMVGEDDVIKVLDDAREEKIAEGAIGAAAGLVAFGYKSGIGSASRQVVIDNVTFIVGALAMLNLGTREALRAGGSAAGPPPPLRGTAFIVIATDAPLDDRQCRRVAATSLHGLARLGSVPAAREGVAACAISTGVQLTRNDRRARQIELPRVSENIVASVAGAAADAAEEASSRTLTTVKADQGTAEYPALPAARSRQLLRSLARQWAFAAALLGSLSAATVGCSASGSQTPAPETILVGQFVTLDPSRPRVEALGVAKGRIISAGSRADVERFASDTTRRISIPGVGVPGFADAHVHLSGLGQQLERLNLRGLTKAQVLAKVAEAARVTPAGGWVTGSGWDQGFFQPAVFPTASDLDAVSGDHPVALSRIDGHSSWVNSKVLALAGLSRATPDPPGGRIVRGASNQPTGILVDRAQDAVSRIRPSRASSDDRMRHIRGALQQYARWGLTSVHDAGTDLETIAAYKALHERDELPVRLYVMARGREATEHYLQTGPELDLGGGLLAVRSFKVVSDGALGSRGAELTEPYADAPNERGLQQVSDADLDRLVRSAREKRIQVNVHAIGDRAVRRVLDVFERAGVAREDRFRIEHASMIAPADVPRFGRLGIIASIQPVFVGEYSRWAEERVGATRIRWVLPVRDLVASGAPIAFGTDFTASDSGDPIATLSGAVLRRGADGTPQDGWYKDQAIDLDKTLRLMTIGPAFAAFQEDDLGQLTVGRYADITVLSDDPYKLTADDLRKVTVKMTILAGRVTFDSRTGS